MTKKHERQCWFCGGKDMEKTDYGSRCSACGSTWTDLPKPSFPELEQHRNIPESIKSGGPSTIYSMSKTVKRKAAKAREAARAKQ